MLVYTTCHRIILVRTVPCTAVQTRKNKWEMVPLNYRKLLNQQNQSELFVHNLYTRCQTQQPKADAAALCDCHVLGALRHQNHPHTLLLLSRRTSKIARRNKMLYTTTVDYQLARMEVRVLV